MNPAIPEENLTPLKMAMKALIDASADEFYKVMRAISNNPNRPKAGYTEWPKEATYSVESTLIPGRGEYLTFIIPLISPGVSVRDAATLKWRIERTPITEQAPPLEEWIYTMRDWRVASVEALAAYTNTPPDDAKDTFDWLETQLKQDFDYRRREMQE